IHPTWERDFMKGLLPSPSSSSSNNKQPYIVGLVGMPGSGKTISGKILCDLLNENNKNDAIVLPMDGYHYSLEKLNSMNNPKDLVYRRGAPDTFDVTALKNDLHQIKYGSEDGLTCTIFDPSNVNNASDSAVVRIPGFDHAIGDPIPNVHIFDRDKHNIVIMEGLYLLHQDQYNRNDWNGVTNYFDETIYIDMELKICMERLKKRNLCLPGYTTPDEIDQRVDIVDHQNALLVQHTKHRANTIVI
ncbi:P-loop containing nucleoside triphosphate hydrolase protein, partial [Fragilariopsis cylindrus CCMP1102]